MHVFPQLRKLEEKYSNELVVVGVHSAKFTAEKDTENVRKAILRYEIEHPVANDSDFVIWQTYAVRAWPTLMFVDPRGKVIGKHEGEIVLDPFDNIIAEMVREFDADGLIDRRPMSFKLESEREWERPLSFPGKVLADAGSGRLFVADSNHNRVLVATLDGEVTQVIGSGERGHSDGPAHDARFDDPQGMALDGDALYVADTKNHSIRKVALDTGRVETIAGVGEQAMRFHAGGDGPSTALNSPWDLELRDGTLYVAMAGFHQLWRLHLDTGEVRPHAGSGRENIVDGPLDSAQLAQPSGIASIGGKLYFTDSETSAIRAADVDPGGRVQTVVGQGLFTFGDADGVGDDVRLQHPIGIDAEDGVLYITDSYNNKIKRVYPDTRGCTTMLGSGAAGHKDGPAREAEFYEPAGVSAAAGKLYVADTNNHAIRVADLETGDVETLDLRGL